MKCRTESSVALVFLLFTLSFSELQQSESLREVLYLILVSGNFLNSVSIAEHKNKITVPSDLLIINLIKNIREDMREMLLDSRSCLCSNCLRSEQTSRESV